MSGKYYGKMTGKEIVESQESSPQIFLYFEKHQKGYLELAIPTTEKVKQIKNRILFERNQAREEMANKINEFIEKRTVSESPTWLTLKIDIATFVNNLLGEGEKKW